LVLISVLFKVIYRQYCFYSALVELLTIPLSRLMKFLAWRAPLRDTWTLWGWRSVRCIRWRDPLEGWTRQRADDLASDATDVEQHKSAPATSNNPI